MGILDMLFGRQPPRPESDRAPDRSLYTGWDMLRLRQSYPNRRPFAPLVPDVLEPYLYGTPARSSTGYQQPRGGDQSGDVMPTPNQMHPAERPNPWQPGRGSAQPAAFRPGLQGGQNYPNPTPYWDQDQHHELPPARLPPGWQPPQQGPDPEMLRRMMEAGRGQMGMPPPAPVDPNQLWREQRRRGRPRMI